MWKDYELLDSGHFEKCERFGDVVVARPEPIALWQPVGVSAWKTADVVFHREGTEGDWEIRKTLPRNWKVQWEDLAFILRTTSFKHTGVFPEQAENWTWIRDNIKPGMKVLNLFGYTGGATLAAASAGAEETVHVDGSKPAVTWARENAEASGLGNRKIRWIEDDVQKFVAREIRRENRYDAIFLDPPAFGRGPKGELWKFEDHLPLFLEELKKILNPNGGMLLLNAYSLGFPTLAVEQLVRAAMPMFEDVQASELMLKESTKRGFEIPTGIAVRCV